MKKFILKTNQGKEFEASLLHDELVYGCMGILVGFDNPINNEKMEGVTSNFAFHPMTNEKLPIVAIKGAKQTEMLVPSHIREHFLLAQKYGLPFKQVVAPLFVGEGEQKIRPDLPIQKRESVIAVVKHFAKDEYLCLDVCGRNCRSFVLGGRDNGETPEIAALREIAEETGYANIKINHVYHIMLLNHFYADYKQVNRHATLHIVFCDLVDESKTELSEREAALHKVTWVNKNELKNFITVKNNQFVIDIILHGERAYEGDGLMINSGTLDGNTRAQAKRLING